MSRKSCTFNNIPLHKKVPGTNFIIDCFNIDINDRPEELKYFLTHFHADHYTGLSKKSSKNKIIYCSETTASLAHMKLGVPFENFVVVPMYAWHYVDEKTQLFLIDANHCPGAVCVIFKVNDKMFLHCGDFRAGKEFYYQFQDININFKKMFFENSDTSLEEPLSLLTNFTQENSYIEVDSLTDDKKIFNSLSQNSLFSTVNTCNDKLSIKSNSKNDSNIVDSLEDESITLSFFSLNKTENNITLPKNYGYLNSVPCKEYKDIDSDVKSTNQSNSKSQFFSTEINSLNDSLKSLVYLSSNKINDTNTLEINYKPKKVILQKQISDIDSSNLDSKSKKYLFQDKVIDVDSLPESIKSKDSLSQTKLVNKQFLTVKSGLNKGILKNFTIDVDSLPKSMKLKSSLSQNKDIVDNLLCAKKDSLDSLLEKIKYEELLYQHKNKYLKDKENNINDEDESFFKFNYNKKGGNFTTYKINKNSILPKNEIIIYDKSEYNDIQKDSFFIKENSQLKNFLISDIYFDAIYLDNTYEGFKHFDSQEVLIHKIIQKIEEMLSCKSCLIPIDYTFLFATYCIGKEKVFFAVAEFFDFEIFVEKPKKQIYDCFSTYTKNKLDKDVKKIIENYKTKFKESITVEKNSKRQKISFFATNICKPKKLKKTYDSVFDRLSENESGCKIKLISMMHINQAKIHEKVVDSKSNKICVLVGSGWNNKTSYFNWKKSNGQTVKKGIELIYFPYSEHSSSTELYYFKNFMNYGKIINTVKNTWDVTEKR